MGNRKMEHKSPNKQNSEQRCCECAGRRYLVSGEVDEEAGLGLQVLATGEADAVPEELQRRVDEGQQADGNDVPDKQTDINWLDEKSGEAWPDREGRERERRRRCADLYSS